MPRDVLSIRSPTNIATRRQTSRENFAGDVCVYNFKRITGYNVDVTNR
jgi:hypothetical protein